MLTENLSSKQIQLNKLLETIKNKYNFDLTVLEDSVNASKLIEHHQSCKQNIIENSAFNSYAKDEHYIKHTLILETLKLVKEAEDTSNDNLSIDNFLPKNRTKEEMRKIYGIAQRLIQAGTRVGNSFQHLAIESYGKDVADKLHFLMDPESSVNDEYSDTAKAQLDAGVYEIEKGLDRNNKAVNFIVNNMDKIEQVVELSRKIQLGKVKESRMSKEDRHAYINGGIMTNAPKLNPAHSIEAYGVKGHESKRWKKTFKNQAQLDKWLDDNNAELSGKRNINESAHEDIDVYFGFNHAFENDLRLKVQTKEIIEKAVADKVYYFEDLDLLLPSVVFHDPEKLEAAHELFMSKWDDDGSHIVKDDYNEYHATKQAQKQTQESVIIEAVYVFGAEKYYDQHAKENPSNFNKIGKGTVNGEPYAGGAVFKSVEEAVKSPHFKDFYAVYELDPKVTWTNEWVYLDKDSGEHALLKTAPIAKKVRESERNLTKTNEGPNMNKFNKGDIVLILRGSYKGKKAIIESFASVNNSPTIYQLRLVDDAKRIAAQEQNLKLIQAKTNESQDELIAARLKFLDDEIAKENDKKYSDRQKEIATAAAKGFGRKTIDSDQTNESNTFDKHKTNIAKKTLKMSDAGALVAGGMTKKQARDHLVKIGYSEQQIKKLEEGTNMNDIEKQILESMDLEKAEVVLAVKNISDDLQNMIEKASKMQIEDLLPIIERVKGEWGIDFAQTIEQNLSSALQQAVDALKQTKDAVDNESLKLSGELPIGSMGGEEVAAPTDETPSDDNAEDDNFSGHASAEGPKDEPLGRARKESVDNKGKAINEDITPVDNLVNKLAGMVDILVKKNEFPDNKSAIAHLMKVNNNLIKTRVDPNTVHQALSGRFNIPYTQPTKFASTKQNIQPGSTVGTIGAQKVGEMAGGCAVGAGAVGGGVATTSANIASIPRPVGDFGPKKKKVIRREDVKVKENVPDGKNHPDEHMAKNPVPFGDHMENGEHKLNEPAFRKPKIAETVDISDLGLHDKVNHKKYGMGIVIKCTEKPSITVKFENGETKTFAVKSDKEFVSEKWDTKMHTKASDKGMFDGKTIAELNSMRSKLKAKKDHTAEETKKLKQIDFALRAKHNFGKVKESAEQPFGHKKFDAKVEGPNQADAHSSKDKPVGVAAKSPAAPVEIVDKKVPAGKENEPYYGKITPQVDIDIDVTQDDYIHDINDALSLVTAPDNKSEQMKHESIESKLSYISMYNGKQHDIHDATSLYDAKQKAIAHFKPKKSQEHMVHVHLAQKGGKDVVHTATESIEIVEAKIKDLECLIGNGTIVDPKDPRAKELAKLYLKQESINDKKKVK